MEESLRKQANLRLLQRTFNTTTDNNNTQKIEDILATATHAVLYEFDAAQQNWKKCHIEGSLFLVSGSSRSSTSQSSFYALIILNRSSTDNFQLQISLSLQVQHQDPYLILRLMTNQSEPQQPPTPQMTTIWGIWFHNADERVAMHRVLQTVLQTLKDAPTATATSGSHIPHRLPADNSESAQTHPRSASVPQSSSSNIDATAAAMAAVTLKTVLGIGIDSSATTSNSNDGTNRAASVVEEGAASESVTTTTTTTPVLDKKSLQLALLSLIQDDRFLDLLHSQYLRVARTRAKKNQHHHQQQPPGSGGDSNP